MTEFKFSMGLSQKSNFHAKNAKCSLPKECLRQKDAENNALINNSLRA